MEEAKKQAIKKALAERRAGYRNAFEREVSDIVRHISQRTVLIEIDKGQLRKLKQDLKELKYEDPPALNLGFE